MPRIPKEERPLKLPKIMVAWLEMSKARLDGFCLPGEPERVPIFENS